MGRKTKKNSSKPRNRGKGKSSHQPLPTPELRTQPSTSKFESMNETLKKKMIVSSNSKHFPKWQTGNKYSTISEGYRVNYKSYWELFLSIFEFHNETLNIWTHLLGALFFFSMAIYFLTLYSPDTAKYESFVRSKLVKLQGELPSSLSSLFTGMGGRDLFKRVMDSFENFGINYSNFSNQENLVKIYEVLKEKFDHQSAVSLEMMKEFISKVKKNQKNKIEKIPTFLIFNWFFPKSIYSLKIILNFSLFSMKSFIL